MDEKMIQQLIDEKQQVQKLHEASLEQIANDYVKLDENSQQKGIIIPRRGSQGSESDVQCNDFYEEVSDFVPETRNHSEVAGNNNDSTPLSLSFSRQGTVLEAYVDIFNDLSPPRSSYVTTGDEGTFYHLMKQKLTLPDSVGTRSESQPSMLQFGTKTHKKTCHPL